MDYLSDGDIYAIASIAIERPDIGIWASSTPTGKRGKFYEYCFLPGTKILTPYGEKNIESIEIGDRVYGIEGNIEKVTQTFMHDTNMPIYNIKTHHLYRELSCTENHPILTNSGWKDAGDITTEDFIMIPSPKEFLDNRPQVEIVLNEHDKKRLEIAKEQGTRDEISRKYNVGIETVSRCRSQYKKDGMLGILDKRRKENFLLAQEIIDNLEPTDSLQKIAGYYLAEGCVWQYHKHKYVSGIRIAFSSAEKHKALEAGELIKEVFKVDYRIEDRTHKGVWECIIDSSVIGIVFKTLFGEKELKRIPDFLLGHSNELLMFEYLMSGDGHIRKDNGKKVINLTATRALEQFYHMLIRNEQVFSLSKTLSSKKRDFCTLYELSQDWHFKWIDKNLFLKVKEVTRSKDTSVNTVYNFETSDSHTYVAELFAVHNCMEAQRGVAEVPPGVYEGDIYTVFYFPSTVLPTWSEKVEQEWRLNLSPEAWEHEVMANFGQETIGVFNKEFIDRAKLDYEYTTHAGYAATRIIGVDWDKYQSTPQILVLEYDPTIPNSKDELGMFKVINRDSVPRSDFTLDNAVEKIIEFNSMYNPAYIYMDRGFGEYQIETLRKRGLEAREAGRSDPAYGLDTKVVGIAFNQHLEVRDPVSKMVEKKPVKPFMVNQTVLVLERDKLVLNEKDSMLWRQMENYQVVRRSGVDGRPTYTSENEHALDALMLAILGFTLEFPNIAQTIYVPDVTRSMAIASPINRSEPNFSPPKIEKDTDEEFFLTNEARQRSSQQWFKSGDFKKSKNSPLSIPSNLVRPRGRGSGKKGNPYNRPIF